MAWLCSDCMTCHKRGDECPPKKTLEELQEESRVNLEKLLKQLDEAEKRTKESDLHFDVDFQPRAGIIPEEKGL